MKKTYLVKKDPAKEGSDNWLIMSCKEYINWRKTPEGQSREIIFGKVLGAEREDDLLFIESGKKDQKKHKSVENATVYRHKNKVKSGIKTLSIEGMHNDENDLGGEGIIFEESYCMEDDVIHSIELEELRRAVADLPDMERNIIDFFFLKKGEESLDDMLRKYDISSSALYRKKDTILADLGMKLAAD